MCVPCAKQVICGGEVQGAAGQILESQADQWESDGRITHGQAQEMRAYAATLAAVGGSLKKLGAQISGDSP